MGWKFNLLALVSLSLPYPGLVTASSTEQFDERLNIRTLRDGKVASHFSFKTLLRGTTPRDPATLDLSDSSQHYAVFPLALGQILREYAVTELHLTLNAGNWNYDRWGYPDEPGVGTGAELWAWMGESELVSVDYRWLGLRNALAGLFCASLAAMDEHRTTSPILPFPPEGSLPKWDLPHKLRHASLPSEHVCTENLTPFLKLLPCKSLSGLASLLNPHKIFDADWHGLGVHVLWRPDEGIEVRLTFQAVLDPLRSPLVNKRDWSFNSIFDRRVDRTCPIATSSSVVVALPTDENIILMPNPSATAGSFAVFDLKQGAEPLDISMQWPDESVFQYPLRPDGDPLAAISVQRTLRGSSQARGQLLTVIKNNYPTELKLIYLETMPWLLQFYLHTLRVHCNASPCDDLMSDMIYKPPVPHSRPSTFQIILTLPPNSTIQVTVEVLKSFLRYTEHPPDAQRGWDLPPAVLVPFGANDNGTTNQRMPRMYTPILLADLATPDFSMPYNVIIFSCSLIAFIFGSIFNLLTRKFVVVKLDQDEAKLSAGIKVD